METQGKRLPDGQIPTKPGEYAKIIRQNGETDWLGVPPKEGMIAGTFLKNSVTEHANGSITVEPLLTYNKNYPDFPQWQGYLIRGIWFEEAKVFIVCKECGCKKEIYPQHVPKGACHFCENDFGYYTWIKGEAPKGVEDLMPLHEEDILVIDTTLPAIVGKNAPNFDRIFSIEREGKIIYAKNS